MPRCDGATYEANGRVARWPLGWAEEMKESHWLFLAAFWLGAGLAIVAGPMSLIAGPVDLRAGHERLEILTATWHSPEYAV